MREAWSINALSLELGTDRRTIGKWLSRSEVKPVEDGPNGPLYRLKDLIDVLVDAPVDLLGNTERRSLWSANYYDARGVRQFAGRVLRALGKRVPSEAHRAIRELIAAELNPHLEECEACMKGKSWKRGTQPDWAAMSDAQLNRALRALIDVGSLEESAQ